MKDSLFQKLATLTDRLQELDGLLSDPSTIAAQSKFRELARERSEIAPVAEKFSAYLANREDIALTQEMLKDSDRDIRAMAEEELSRAQASQLQQEEELKVLLLPKDPADESNTFVEIRAGTGGDEAALFAGDLLRMYIRYAEQRGWKLEIMSASESDAGGYKEVVTRVLGRGAYSRLKFESGAHRVQRVPATESQGRIHTSACTVAILPEMEEIEEILVEPSDLRVDTFRSSGAGGQHVNKTDSAVRLTHLPTGIVVECQDERSQHKNRARALSLLKARLLAAERERQQSERAETRRNLVGSGDRSERIRTYNFPQGRVTDHRINLTVYKLDEVLQGNIDLLIDPLVHEYQADLMSNLAQ